MGFQVVIGFFLRCIQPPVLCMCVSLQIGLFERSDSPYVWPLEALVVMADMIAALLYCATTASGCVKGLMIYGRKNILPVDE